MAVILARRARYRLMPNLRSPRLLAWALCLLFLALLEWSVVSFAAGGGNVHGRYVFPAMGVLATGAALGLGALPFGRHGVHVVAVLIGMHVLSYMVANQYLEAAAPQVAGRTPLETALISVNGPPAWLMLGLLGAVVAALTAVQAMTMWRLAPPATGYVLLPSRRRAGTAPTLVEPPIAVPAAAEAMDAAPPGGPPTDPAAAPVTASTGG
jgi:hypothetical protein